MHGVGDDTGFWGERQLRELLPVGCIDHVVQVDLGRTPAADADVRELYLLRGLEAADVYDTRVTKQEIMRLRKAGILAHGEAAPADWFRPPLKSDSATKLPDESCSSP
jgi:hypothetical protein